MKNKILCLLFIGVMLFAFTSSTYAYHIFYEVYERGSGKTHGSALAHGRNQSEAMKRYKEQTKSIRTKIVLQCESGWAADFSYVNRNNGRIAQGFSCGGTDEKSAIESAKEAFFKYSRKIDIDWNAQKHPGGYVHGLVWYDNGSAYPPGNLIKGADGKFTKYGEDIAIDKAGNIYSVKSISDDKYGEFVSEYIYAPKVFKAPKIVKKKTSGNKDGRFRTDKAGVVIDTTTGLMWADADNGSPINFYDAVRYCENFNEGGYSDWRMPTRKELETLYKSGPPQPGRCGSLRGHKPLVTPFIELSCSAFWVPDPIERNNPNYDNLGYRDEAWVYTLSSGDYLGNTPKVGDRYRQKWIRILPVRDYR